MIVLKRLARVAATLLLLLTVIFVLTQIVGDPVQQLLPQKHTAAQYRELRHSLGYDRPIVVQYLDFLKDVSHLSFGDSVTYGEPALTILLQKLPITIELIIGSLAFAVIIGVPIGIVSGIRARSVWDDLGVALSTLGQAVPSFVIAVMAIFLLAVNIKALPSGGWGTPPEAVLPIISLGLFPMAGIIRLARSSALELVREPFVLLARSKGLNPFQIVFGHMLRLVSIPVLSFGALQFGLLLTGAVVTESVFSIPGAGQLVLNAVDDRDNALIQATVVVAGLFIVVLDIIIDIGYLVLDPRLRRSLRSAGK